MNNTPNLLKFILMMVMICFSCQSNNENQGHTREILPNPEKYEHDNYEPQKITFKPDTSVNGISLLSEKNIESYFGKDVMNKLNHGATSPYITAISKDAKQSLTLHFSLGSVINEFSEFEIKYNQVRDSKSNIKVSEAEFKTESGIRLGITEGDLKSIKGEPDVVFKKNSYLIYGYEIKDMENSKFLKKYNKSQYYSDYYFINGYLEKFRFGFVHP